MRMAAAAAASASSAAIASGRLWVNFLPHSSSRIPLVPTSWNVAQQQRLLHPSKNCLNRRNRVVLRLHCSQCSSGISTSGLTTFLVSLLASIARQAASILKSLRASSCSPELQQWNENRTLANMALMSTSSAAMAAKAQIRPLIVTLRANPTFMSGLLAWMVAQASKVLTTYIVYRRLDLKMLVASGGMPSSHSALCVALTTSVALSHGVSDALFPVCLGFTLIVMYDATGVRRHAGMQAEVLNMIIKDLFQGHPVSEKKLKELLGHTPLQVIAGAFLGVLVGWWCSLQATLQVITITGIL